jgi:hypothetical protein
MHLPVACHKHCCGHAGAAITSYESCKACKSALRWGNLLSFVRNIFHDLFAQIQYGIPAIGNSKGFEIGRHTKRQRCCHSLHGRQNAESSDSWVTPFGGRRLHAVSVSLSEI